MKTVRRKTARAANQNRKKCLYCRFAYTSNVFRYFCRICGSD